MKLLNDAKLGDYLYVCILNWPCAIVPDYDSSLCNVTIPPLASVIKTVETVTLEVPNGSKSMRIAIFYIQSAIK